MPKKTGTDLFAARRTELTEKEAPLAARMRPRTLDEFIGQGHIVGPGRLLRRAIQADQLSSVIFYGPPGTGKTTLARIIANTTLGHFIAINAVLAGVNEIRQAIAEAQERRGQFGQLGFVVHQLPPLSLSGERVTVQSGNRLAGLGAGHRGTVRNYTDLPAICQISLDKMNT